MAKTIVAKQQYKRVTVKEYQALQDIKAAFIEYKQAETKERERIEAAQKAIETRKRAPINRDRMENILTTIGVSANALRTMALSDGIPHDDTTPLEVFCEKIGWLADQGLSMMGCGGVCGDFGQWSGLPPETES